MSLCYACRNTIDSLTTRCPYCTSAVDPYSGAKPTNNEQQLEQQLYTESQVRIQWTMYFAMAALVAFLFNSWWTFFILAGFGLFCSMM